MATMKTLNGYGFNATELNGKTSDSYLLKTDTAANSTNSQKLGGKVPEYYLQPRNLLDNSDFLHPVNQRGVTSKTNNGYFIDRWVIYSADEAKRVTSIDSNGLTTAGGSAVRQVVSKEVTPKDVGEYTFAICKSDGIIDFPDIWKDSNGNLVCPLGSAGTYIWAALYEGNYTADTLPPYVPKGYPAELTECQRYFYKMKSYWKWVSAGICETSTKAFIPIVLPREMRIVPTVSITNPSLIKVKCGSIGPQIPSDIKWTYGILDARIMQMQATVTGATGGNVAFLYFDDGGEITFSADL